MNRAEELHMAMLSYELRYPTPRAEEIRKAETVCRLARRLLREDYGLEGDWPCDHDIPARVESTPTAGDIPGRARAAIADFQRARTREATRS